MAPGGTVESTAMESPRALALAHAALDELGVPRTSERGRLTLFGRIEALRAGQFDQARLSRPRQAQPLRPCPRCGLMALVELGSVCPSCSADLEAPPAAQAG
jgi:rubrerythrin